MKIAIIGSRKSIEIVKNTILKGYFFIETVYFTFDKYSEVIDILKENESEVDAVLFTGKTTFQYATNFIKPSVPWEYVPRNRMSFVYTMIKAIYTNKYDISKISIDSYSEKVIYETFEEIGYKKEDVSIYQPNYNILDPDYMKNLIEFHENCFKSGQVKLCITGIYDVYEILNKLNVPCMHVDFSTDVIMEYINKLRLRYQLKVNEDSNLITINTTVDMLKEYSIYSKSEFQILQHRNTISEIIYGYAQRIGAATLRVSDDNYYLFTTKSVIENDTNKFEYFKLLNELHNKPYIQKVSIGIGLGHDPLESKNNAEIANSKSSKSDIDCLFIMDKDNKLIGPITSATKNSENKKVDKYLLEISEKTGIGISTIHKLESIINQYNIDTITTNELSKLCGISSRSINRIIVKLEDKGYVRVVGKTSSPTNGRPSRLIKIDFNSKYQLY